MFTRKTFAYCLALVLFMPNLVNKDISPTLSYNHKEKYDQRYAYINSVEKLEQVTDSIAAVQHIAPRSFEYVELLEGVIEKRFYHSFSHFSLHENWIAAAAGYLLKEDYACKVQPDEIMKHPYAACSQQSLVMMNILRNKQLNYRSIGFPHHYAMEVQMGNDWYFFDANMEPGMNKEQRKLSNWQHKNDLLKPYYDTNRFSDLDYKFGTNLIATTGPINEIPAANARLFHAITGFASKLLWCVPLMLLLMPLRLRLRTPFVFRKPVSVPASLSVPA